MVEDSDKEILTKFSDTISSNTELGLAIPVVRKGTTHDKRGRVVIAFSARTLVAGVGDVIQRAFLIEGAELKVGDAPRGPKERQIASFFNFGPEARESS